MVHRLTMNGWQYVHALAAQINNVPLPAVPEVFGVRLPPASECLTAVDFDLVPNPPPPEVKFYDEEVEEIEEESEEEEEEDMPEHVGHTHTPAAHARYPSTAQSEDAMMQDGSSAPAGSPERELPPVRPVVLDEDDDEDDDDLFAGGDDDDDAGDDAMDTQVDAPPPVQRALVEDDDYD
jgi:transcription initiation factor TFIID subunit 9B